VNPGGGMVAVRVGFTRFLRNGRLRELIIMITGVPDVSQNTASYGIF
jgi:hypothetical protein